MLSPALKVRLEGGWLGSWVRGEEEGLAAADYICHSMMAVYTLDTLLVIILILNLEMTFFNGASEALWPLTP